MQHQPKSYILKEKNKMVEYLLTHKGIPDREKKMGKHLRDIKFAGGKLPNTLISNLPVSLLTVIMKEDEEDLKKILNEFI